MKYIKTYEELKFEDALPNEFLVFRKEYNKLKNDGSYFVQFTNHKNDVLDRSIYNDPNHSDPSGNYGYPLKYIIDFPSDFWYGNNSKFLRVLKRTTKCNTLHINMIHNEQSCIDELMKVHNYKYSVAREAIYLIKTNFKTRLGLNNSGYWGRVFLQILQVDPFSSDFNDYELRSAPDQSQLLLNAGYDAIEDTSKKDTTAVINNREPEQICFLNRKGFIVEKIFTLKHNINGSVSNIYDPRKSNIPITITQKLLNAMGDSIKEQNKKGNYTTYYSKEGRSISIEFEKDQSYYINKKIGQKTHRTNKTHDENLINIEVLTEKGKISYKSKMDESVENIINKLIEEWDLIKDTKSIPGWIPQSIKLIEEEAIKRREAYYTKVREDESKKNLSELKTFIVSYNKWCKELELDFKFNGYDSALTLYTEGFKIIVNTIKKELNWEEYLNNDLQEMVLLENPNFDISLLNKFIETFTKIIKKLLEYDSKFIEYNFYNKI